MSIRLYCLGNNHRYFFNGVNGGDIMAAVSIGFSERLKQEKIFTPEKADAFARALNGELSDQLATKADLIQMENKIIKWMVGLTLASIAINLSVIGFFTTL